MLSKPTQPAKHLGCNKLLKQVHAVVNNGNVFHPNYCSADLKKDPTLFSFYRVPFGGWSTVSL